jgi:hypothetical protein
LAVNFHCKGLCTDQESPSKSTENLFSFQTELGLPSKSSDPREVFLLLLLPPPPPPPQVP